MNTITPELLASLRSKAAADNTAATLSATMAKTELKDLAFLPLEAAKLEGPFTIELKTRGITAQERSGRCWMFSLMNMLREKAADSLGQTSFALSGNYLAFYDKLEKANNALEMAIEYANEPLDCRMMEYILSGYGDGGYWEMAVDLVNKYGVVPQSVMPESYQSTHTETFTRLCKSMVRKDIAELRSMVAAGLDPQPRKQEMLAEIYKAQCIAFGTPVEKFDFSYRDDQGVYHILRDLTPKAFYDQFIGMDLSQYVPIANYPTWDLPMNRVFTFHYIGNMAEGRIAALNLPQAEFEALCQKQLEGGEPVWFGCDSGAFGARKEGVWDQNSFAYFGLLGGADFTMEKGQRIEHLDSNMSHAMILVGVNLDADGKPDRWKIENSWGGEVGKAGYFVCSESYFREYAYGAVIHKKYMTEQQLAMLEEPPVEIHPWRALWM